MTDGLWQLSLNCYWSSVAVTYVVLVMDSNICTVLTVIGYGFLGFFLFFPFFVFLWDFVDGPLQYL
jgi:hypothetical protein